MRLSRLMGECGLLVRKDNEEKLERLREPGTKSLIIIIQRHL